MYDFLVISVTKAVSLPVSEIKCLEVVNHPGLRPLVEGTHSNFVIKSIMSFSYLSMKTL